MHFYHILVQNVIQYGKISTTNYQGYCMKKKYGVNVAWSVFNEYFTNKLMKRKKDIQVSLNF